MKIWMGKGEYWVIQGVYWSDNRLKVIEAVEPEGLEMFGKIKNFSSTTKFMFFSLLCKINIICPLKMTCHKWYLIIDLLLLILTAWKVFVLGVILVQIFQHSKWTTPNMDNSYAVTTDWRLRLTNNWNSLSNIKKQTPSFSSIKWPFFTGIFHYLLSLQSPWQRATIVINSVFNL